MKLALIGYGKMGKAVEEAALSRKHTIHVVIDNADDWKSKGHLLKECDAAIEFSIPAMAVSNMYACFDAGIPVVCGTTGWNEKAGEVKARCIEKNGALLYASNFSVGVNIFFEINRRLARLMNTQDNYEVSIEEVHHTQKLDAPSGTAITLAEDIIRNIDGKSKWKNEKTDNPSDLFIQSVRQGTVPGTHTVTYESENDFITIRHEAKSRKGLAAGALLAAEFIAGKKGIFSMKDLLGI
ncbi:MAG TPA: 4-hydroxy-tetrahydrodipicolinate reductase [Bacteroidales bacterium]|mgnify:CR=1 FL=1|nr:4-hydroxy-tetrahydrodipicolinate reductase [Bacteroidales bacterium]HPT01136.1 4-hydroxy-tetrahydrodipicolinate reductase [Bacteroidales bacterium]